MAPVSFSVRVPAGPAAGEIDGGWIGAGPRGDQMRQGSGRERGGDREALRRICAFVVDQFVVVLYLGGLAALGVVWVRSGIGGGTALLLTSPIGVQVAAFGLLTIPMIMYYAAWEGSRLGATPGKLLLGVRVRSHEGGALGMGPALVRAGTKCTPLLLLHLGLSAPSGVWFVAGVVVVAGWIVAVGVVPGGWAPWDLAAGSRVERGGPGRLRVRRSLPVRWSRVEVGG